MAGLRVVDVVDAVGFARVPPCADPRFDHRTCDYWEDADRGARDARPGWLAARAPAPSAPPAPSDNPFAPRAAGSDRRRDALASLLGEDDDAQPTSAAASLSDTPEDPTSDAAWNPFAPAVERPARPDDTAPRKLGLLTRGTAVFGSYARVLVDEHDRPAAYAQFGPLSAYPRARRIRELYPRLPSTPLPAVITCIATTTEAHGKGYARHLVDDVCLELGRRGFAAVEVYPDLTQTSDATSAASPAFWLGCGFSLVIADDRYPVLRLELD